MSNYGDLIQEYYVKKFRANAAQRKAEIDALKTPEDAKKFIAKVRARIAGAYDFPAEKCDLNVRITGSVEREDLIVQNVIYTCGHTTCTAGTPVPFANAASLRFMPG